MSFRRASLSHLPAADLATSAVTVDYPASSKGREALSGPAPLQPRTAQPDHRIPSEPKHRRDRQLAHGARVAARKTSSRTVASWWTETSARSGWTSSASKAEFVPSRHWSSQRHAARQRCARRCRHSLRCCEKGTASELTSQNRGRARGSSAQRSRRHHECAWWTRSWPRLAARRAYFPQGSKCADEKSGNQDIFWYGYCYT